MLGFKDLIVYQKAYKLAMDIFRMTSNFPKEERYALTDQIRRSSRSICSNISEGYGKRVYPKHFSSKMTDADGEKNEVMVWLDFCKDCNYITEEKHGQLMRGYEEVGRLLWFYIENPEKFNPRNFSNK